MFLYTTNIRLTRHNIFSTRILQVKSEHYSKKGSNRCTVHTCENSRVIFMQPRLYILSQVYIVLFLLCKQKLNFKIFLKKNIIEHLNVLFLGNQ